MSNYGSGSLAVLPTGPDGELGEIVSSVQHEGAGPNPARQSGPHAHATIFTPDGGFLIAADLGIDRLVVQAVDPRTGAPDTARRTPRPASARAPEGRPP